MTFNFDNGSVEVTKEKAIFKCADKIIYTKTTSSFINYSLTRPFSLDATDWEFVCEEENDNEYIVTYRKMPIEAVVKFSGLTDVLKLSVEFINVSDVEIADFAGSISVDLTGNGKNKMTLPNMIYNDNPSAVVTKIVPHIGDEAGKGIIVEEHRLPITAVNGEWKINDESYFMTLFLYPQVVTGDEREYWSLGIVKEEDGESMVALSGPIMFNGYKDVVYGGRNVPMSWLKGYRYIRPNESVKKECAISFGATEEGKGFRNIIELGYNELKPHTERLHTYEEMVDFKKNVLDSRYYKDDKCCGYMTFGSANSFGNVSGRPEYFLYGWTGQTVKLAWCDMALALKNNDAKSFDRAYEIVDFFVKNGQHKDFPGLFYGYYLIEKDEWRGVWKNPDAALASRIEGESVADLIDVMTLLRENNREVPAEWEKAVLDACAFIMNPKFQTEDNIYPLGWELDGTIKDSVKNAAGMPCVLALAKAAEYFDNAEFLDYAKEKYAVYADLHMKTFDIPFARATMDAKCEDKEAGLYFFETAAELYRMTKEERFRKWAEISGDWILTFVFFWETGFAKDTACAKKNFKTTGWPGVSVQNHHLDVFFPSYEMYRFGKNSGIKKFEDMGKNVCAALTYGVCTEEGEWGFTVIGEQGEHYYHTNYFQARNDVIRHMHNWRGGSQVWNPSWITAQVMSSNLHFMLDK